MAITRGQAIAESIRRRATVPADEASVVYQGDVLTVLRQILNELEKLNELMGAWAAKQNTVTR